MIALIALLALAVTVGMIIGIFAIFIALMKATIRGIRKRGTVTTPVASEGAVGDPLNATDQEFLRLITTEWP